MIKFYKYYFFITIILLLISIISFFNLYSILRIEKKVSSDIAVVEGWMSDNELLSAANHINKNDFRAVIVSGNKIERGKSFLTFDNYAYSGKKILENNGITKPIFAAPIDVSKKRTIESTYKIKELIDQKFKNCKSVTIFTIDIHSRRTFESYKKTFSDTNIKVGIIPIKHSQYNKNNWLNSSYGIKNVIIEFIALLYYYVNGR